MRLTAFLILLLISSIVFQFLGEPSAYNKLLDLQNGTIDNPTQYSAGSEGLQNAQDTTDLDVNNAIIDRLIGSLTIPVLATSALTLAFAGIYAVPIMLLIVVANIFIFPFGNLLVNGNPVIATPIILLFNLLTALAAISFVRGGNT